MNSQFFDLVEHTNRHIFLTGKAGTGKTTFLNDFVQRTEKQYIVVAPTGIAAINAGGVTIHSMFGFPLRAFVPTTDRIDGSQAMNIADLSHHFKYRKEKLKLLREVEIIIIDEVSMLRADVLDMMDFALRHIRRNQQRFGGVQMLFIGDLYQLPPVVRDENMLRNYYRSPFFFDSYALKDTPLITIELTKVYRQQDAKFVEILNAIRDGYTEDIDFELLNSRYQPDFKATDEKYVYLTSHNKMADDINANELKSLPGKSYIYEANIVGDFKENQYPNDEKLELKVGAQIMFIRNDASSEKKYYNGKLAEVLRLDEEEICVWIEGSDEEYILKREVWEQKRYYLDTEKNIQEEVLGSFEQFPIKLAWAVTIHKSQGLTFDRVIIDAGKSFTSGQVYVALSRCRTLEGIVLKSKITPEIIFTDTRVAKFQDETHANENIDAILAAEKYDYSIHKLLQRLDCRWMSKELETWNINSVVTKNLDKEKAKTLYLELKVQLQKLNQIFEKLEKVLLQKLYKFIHQKESWDEVEGKAKGAVNFFFEEINTKVFESLKSFYAEIKGVKGLKQYNDDFKVFLEDIEDYLKSIKRLKLLGNALLDQRQEAKDISLKVSKIPTHILTYQLFEAGKTISEIALERGLVKETVFGHLAKFAQQGVLDISRVVVKEKIQTFEKVFGENDNVGGLNDWKKILPQDFDFTEIRILLNHFQYLKNKED